MSSPTLSYGQKAREDESGVGAGEVTGHCTAGKQVCLGFGGQRPVRMEEHVVRREVDGARARPR